MSRRELLNDKIFKLILIHVFLVLFFIVVRIIFILYFGSSNELITLKNNLFVILVNSIRFDSVVSLFGLILLFLLCLFYLFIPQKNLYKFDRFMQVIFKYYTSVLVLLFAIISTLDFFYFKTYDNHFNTLIFALKNDDTSAILHSIWSDYPILTISVIWIILFFFLRFLLLGILNITNPIKIKSAALNYLILFSVIGLYFIGLRGSLGLFPLQLKHAYVTDNQFLNKMIINNVFALKSVISDGDNKDRINTNYTKTLKDYGYNRIDDALNIYTNKHSTSNKSIEESFFKSTSYNSFLVENPPNVLFILVESLGCHFLDLHSANCNTLGSLEKELPDCLVYKNFLSSGNLTITTLESIMVGTAISPITQSPYKFIPLSTSISIPFKKANYLTTFLYGGEYGWRDIGHYAKTQGFDNIITQKYLEKEYPNAETNSWGVHDNYIYDKLFNLLQENSSPQFIFTLTTSNHTPYSFPKNFKPFPIYLSDSILSKMKTNKSISYKSIKAYQYAADQLGRFLKRIKNSELSENTIIAITGDHNSHQGFKYEEDEMFYAHATPLILYIPEKYKKQLVIDLNKFGSHKDIFPTLYNLSLSDAKYYNTGQNLFSTEPSFSINDFKFAANQFGAVKKGNPTLYYKWKNNSNYLLQTTDKNADLDSLLQKMKAYITVMKYKIQKEFDLKK